MQINPDQKKLFIMPSLRNMQVFVFYQLPNGRLVFGTLQIGGNCLIFTPQPRLRSVEYARESKLRESGMVQILTDNIEKIALTDDVRLPRPTRVELLRALGKTQDAAQPVPTHTYEVTVPSPVAVPDESKRQTRILDVNLLEVALETARGDFVHQVDTLCSPVTDVDYPRYLRMKTFRGDHFIFFGPSLHLKLLHEEILEFVLKCNQFNKSELVKETSGTENFDFIQMEPPIDYKNAVDEVTKTGENQFGLFARKAILYKKKVEKQGKKSGAEQIQFLLQKQTRAAKRLLNDKKFETSVATFTAHFKTNQYYTKYGNLIQDTPTQQLWTNLMNANKYELKDFIDTKLNNEPSNSDLIIPLSDEFTEQNKFKLTRQVAKQAHAGHQQSTQIFDDGVAEALKKCRKQKVRALDGKKVKSEAYLGRTSRILSEEELKQIKRYLGPKYEGFKAFVQYQTTVDGRYLANLLNSYEEQKESMCNFVAAGIQEGSDSMGSDSSTPLIDQKKYNLQFDRTKIQFTKPQLLVMELQDAQIAVVVFHENPKVGRFGTHETFILQKTEQGFTQFNSTSKNQVYLVNQNDKLVVGSGSGSAITLFNHLLKAATSPCETFDSPELFKGNRYEKFVEANLNEAEIIRFVVGE
ncbi:TLD_family protein [Hexamita inflata]|uniref:Oxidation resistance protein 1 n=1 Tax=Hexamita inflata TaxID=28002 RepID=A0AA86RXP7_9EUKA|nr:TLD family protein [Hexamita inflata]